MTKNAMRALVVAALVASGCAVESTGTCESDADCTNGGTCVEGICTGGEVPTAKIAALDEVELGAQVTLDGTASAKAAGGADGLTFAWKASVNGADVTVEAGNTASAMLQATVPHATYKVELVVSDRGTPSVVATKEVQVRNAKPVARLVATPAQTAWLRNTPVTLDASTSTDADGDALTYQWTLEKDPATAVGTLTPGENGTATLTPGPTSATYKITVTVSDGTATATESIQQLLENKPPLVNAGDAQTVEHTCVGAAGAKTCKAIGTLTGTVSDTDGTIDEGTIEWKLKSAPAASLASATFSPSASSLSVSFVLSNASTEPIAGAYEFELKAKDNDGTETKSTVVVTVGNRPPVISLGEANPILVGHTFADGNFTATVPVTATVTDEDNDDVTTTFEMTTELVGATVTPGAVTQTTASYAISVALANPTSLIDGTNPLYAVKAHVVDRNAAEVNVEVPVLVQNQSPVQSAAFGGAPLTVGLHTYGTAPAPFPTTPAGYRHSFTGLTLAATDADNDPLTATWTVSGGPAGTVVVVTAGTPAKPTALGFFSPDKAIVSATLLATQTVSDPFGQVVATKQFKMGNRVPTINGFSGKTDVGHRYGAQAWAGAGEFYSQAFAVGPTIADPDGDPFTVTWSATSTAVGAGELKLRATPVAAPTSIELASLNGLIVNAELRVKASLDDGFGAQASPEAVFQMGNRPPTLVSFSAGAATAYSCTGESQSCMNNCGRCLITETRKWTTYNGGSYTITVNSTFNDPDGDPLDVGYASVAAGCAPGTICASATNQFTGRGLPRVICAAGAACPTYSAGYGVSVCLPDGVTVGPRTAVEPSSIHATASDGFANAVASVNVSMRSGAAPGQLCELIPID